MNKNAINFGLEKRVFKAKGKCFTLRTIVQETMIVTEIKVGARKHADLYIYKNNTDCLYVNIRRGCNLALRQYLMSITEYDGCGLIKTFENQAKLLEFLEEFVRIVLTYPKDS